MKSLRYIPFAIACSIVLLWFIAQACIIRHCVLYDTARAIGLPVLLPLGIYAACTILPSLIAARSAHPVFRKWVWFASMWTIVSVIAVALTPLQPNSFFTALPLTRNVTAFVAGILFALISLVITVRPKPKD